jgi:3-oxoacyl-[acyl-carrier-protein] synthase II
MASPIALEPEAQAVTAGMALPLQSCLIAIIPAAIFPIIIGIKSDETLLGPFSSSFVIGEGAAALVLEEYEHAINRGAKIYGEVCGYGSTCDAYHITAPHPQARGGTQAMKEAMKEAGYVDSDKVYINAHGTGTHMNDLVETMAVKNALGDEAAEAYISSTKSMTGHLLGAAGAVEALACIMALNEGIIPPTINLLEQDDECDLNYVPNKAVKADITLALSNSLGFGGHNACLAFRKV